MVEAVALFVVYCLTSWFTVVVYEKMTKETVSNGDKLYFSIIGAIIGILWWLGHVK